VAKSIVITGGTRGIGQGMAREFLRRGHNVCITGRSQRSVDEGLQGLKADAGDAKLIGIPCEVADLGQVQAVWDGVEGGFGGVDIWINNAGIANIMQDFDGIEKQEYDNVVNTNIIGTFNGCKVALIGMKQQGHGQIYNFEGFGSDGRTGNGLSIYGTTKRAVTYFTEALIKEYKDSPVNVGFLSPGIVITNMTLAEADHLPPERWEKTKRIYNIIADKVETVTPWLVEATLADFGKHGSRLAWLNTPKAMGRFFKAFVLRQKRDLFAGLDA
jgi:NAD(P)-dependent dehydrogenase (short-subunit alcohol dehydrogenase family)